MRCEDIAFMLERTSKWLNCLWRGGACVNAVGERHVEGVLYEAALHVK